MIINKKLVLTTAILVFGYQHLHAMECNTTMVGKCKTAGTAFHGCLKTKYKPVYDRVVNDFLKGFNVSLSFVNKNPRTNQPLSEPYITYGFGDKMPNQDANCLQKLERVDYYIKFLDGTLDPLFKDDVQKTAANFADVFNKNDIAARQNAIQATIQAEEAKAAAKKQAKAQQTMQLQQQQQAQYQVQVAAEQAQAQNAFASQQNAQISCSAQVCRTPFAAFKCIEAKNPELYAKVKENPYSFVLRPSGRNSGLIAQVGDNMEVFGDEDSFCVRNIESDGFTFKEFLERRAKPPLTPAQKQARDQKMLAERGFIFENPNEVHEDARYKVVMDHYRGVLEEQAPGTAAKTLNPMNGIPALG
ncbi:MAG: hypothetical protein KBD31_03650 [Proteobacteria bacterium]|nr:hypothetical protein [Pseudomonadota bacterium]